MAELAPMKKEQGFTAVELLVALVVGALLFASAYQLHLNVIRQAADAQWRSVASNAAYDILRTWQGTSGVVSSPCAAHTYNSSQVTIPSYANLSGASATVVVSCPFNDATDVNLLSVTLTYNVNGQSLKVYRAIDTFASS